MNKVTDILLRKSTGPITVKPDTTVMDALKIMADKNIGSVIVMKDEQYLGIVTERDYSRKVLLKGKSSTNTPVSDIMSPGLPHLKPDDSIEHCMTLMTSKNIRYLPVFENDVLTGIISMSDVVKQTILVQQETINQLEHYIHQ